MGRGVGSGVIEKWVLGEDGKFCIKIGGMNL